MYKHFNLITNIYIFVIKLTCLFITIIITDYCINVQFSDYLTFYKYLLNIFAHKRKNRNFTRKISDRNTSKLYTRIIHIVHFVISFDLMLQLATRRFVTAIISAKYTGAASS